MPETAGRKARKMAVAGLVVFIVVCIVVAIVFEKEAVVVGIATGICSSTFAGLAYALFSDMIFGEQISREDFEDLRSAVKEGRQNQLSSDHVQRIFLSMNQRFGHIDQIGIERIADRNVFDDVFWRDAIIEAGRDPKPDSELILFGRTLDKWTNVTFKSLFLNAILNIIRAEGRVQILSLQPNGLAAQFYDKASGRNIPILSRNFERFMDDEVLTKLSPTEKTYIERRYIPELQLTFNLFKSDQLLWISPYLSTTDTGSNIAMTVRQGSAFANSIMNDLDQIKTYHSVIERS